MSIPTYDQFIDPILRFLAKHAEGVRASDVHEAVADALGLDDAQRQQYLNSGQAVYRNRAGWAHDRLKRAGLSSSAKRGHWKLTPEGVAYAAQHTGPLPPQEVERLATIYRSVETLRPKDAVPVDPQIAIDSQPGSASLSPDDRLDRALAELREAIGGDLHDNLLQVSPARFEVIVLDVLHRLGYGTNRHDL